MQCVCVCLYVHVSVCLRVRVSTGVRSHVLLSGGESVKGKGVFQGGTVSYLVGIKNTMKMSKASLEIVYVNELIKNEQGCHGEGEEMLSMGLCNSSITSCVIYWLSKINSQFVTT